MFLPSMNGTNFPPPHYYPTLNQMDSLQYKEMEPFPPKKSELRTSGELIMLGLFGAEAIYFREEVGKFLKETSTAIVKGLKTAAQFVGKKLIKIK